MAAMDRGHGRGRRRAAAAAVAFLLALLAWLLWRPEAPTDSNPVASQLAATGRPETAPIPTAGGASSAAAEATAATPSPPVPSAAAWDLRVEVRDGTGAPLPGAKVLLFDGADSAVGEGVAGEDGAALLRAEGAAQVLVVPGPGLAPRRGERMEPPPEGRRTVEFRFERTRAVEGVVLRADGTTKVYARVRARSLAPDPWLVMRTVFLDAQNSSVDGRFRFEGLSPGPAWVEAEPFDLHEGRRAGVRVEAGETQARILLPGASFVTVLLVDADTDGPVDAPAQILRVLEDGEETLSSCTGGGFGEKGVDIEIPPGGSETLRAVAAGYLPGDAVRATLAPGETRGSVRLVLVRDRDAPQVTFVVTDAEGAPLPQFMLFRILDESGNIAGQAYDLAEGRVTVTFTRGTHHCAVGGVDTAVDPENPWLRQEFDLTLSRGDHPTREIRLVRGGFLRLRVDRKFRSSPVILRSGTARLDRMLRDDPRDEEALLVSGVVPAGAWDVELPEGPKWSAAAVRPGETTDLVPEPR